MNELHIVVDQVGGFAREDPRQARVVGVYTNLKTAQQIKLIAGVEASVQTVAVNAIYPGHRQTATALGFELEDPLRWEDVQKKLFERYEAMAQNNRERLVHRLGEEMYDRLVSMCRYVPSHVGELTEDKSNRWLGFVQGMLTAGGCLDVETERNFCRPLFHKLKGPSDSHQV